MVVEQIYTGCLAQGAYYIESDGEVAIIDPLREVTAYINKAERANAKIKYVFETHFHADFVSGHVDLPKKRARRLSMAQMPKRILEAILRPMARRLKWENIPFVRCIRQGIRSNQRAIYCLMKRVGNATFLRAIRCLLATSGGPIWRKNQP